MSTDVQYDLLPTEQLNPRTTTIDQQSTQDILTTINREDTTVATAVEACIPQLTQLTDAVVEVLKQGGSLVYVGAGTSGRLGVLDAAECPPTFNVDPSMVQAVIAGGAVAMVQAVEGAEDEAEAGRQAMVDLLDKLWRNDTDKPAVLPVVVGLSASGSARFVQAAVQLARQRGCVTGSIGCNPTGPLVSETDYPVVVSVGPEVIAGSTRMKAGTAQKLILNMLSTTCMIQLGKTYENWMVDVKPTNAKLRQRAIRIVCHLGQVDETRAVEVLNLADWQVKPAVVMGRLNCSFEEAQQYLAEHQNKLRLLLTHVLSSA